MHIIPKAVLRAATAAALLGFVAPPVFAADNAAVANDVMAVVRAQWAAEIAGKPAADELVSAADDYTEFNPAYPALVIGKATTVRLYDALAPDSKTLVGEMMNPHVQVYGDTAIVSYNYGGVIKTSDGKTKPTVGNSTRVYVRQGGKWMLVHGHFSPVGAPQN